MPITNRPVILDSWNRLGIEIRLAGNFAFRGDGVSLDLFDPVTNEIDPEKIGNTSLRNHVRLHQARYEQAATNQRRRLLRAGYLSAGDARVQALREISDPINGKALGQTISARFHEIMVDEGQDCNPLDLKILFWLKKSGVHVTFVCDPDQAIYEFRNGNPASVQDFRKAYPIEACLQLTGNFRSSPEICRLAATLRSTDMLDEPIGKTAKIKHPILVIGYRGRGPSAAIGQAFLDKIGEFGLNPSKAIVLAHSGIVAQRAAGCILSNNSNGNSRIEFLARKVAEFWSPSATAQSREYVVQSVELLLLEIMGLYQPGEYFLRTINRVGLDRRAHRRNALHFLMSLPKVCGHSSEDRLAWIASVHAEMKQLNLPLPSGVTIGRFFSSPRKDQWSDHLKAHEKLGLTSAKIHEAKGRQYDAVCVVIPPNRAPENRIDALFESWSNRDDFEAKRVIYVGITRARIFGTIAVPIEFADRCSKLLTSGGVNFIRQDL
jgi:hypothetical protein